MLSESCACRKLALDAAMGGQCRAEPWICLEQGSRRRCRRRLYVVVDFASNAGLHVAAARSETEGGVPQDGSDRRRTQVSRVSDGRY
jgi:hypothetical protein